MLEPVIAFAGLHCRALVQPPPKSRRVPTVVAAAVLRTCHRAAASVDGSPACGWLVAADD